MGKIGLVARAEYLRAVRTKGFLAGILLTPVLIVAITFAAEFLDEAKDLSDRRFGVVDLTGRLYEALEQATTVRNDNSIWDDKEHLDQSRPRYVPELVAGPDDWDEEAGSLALAERVRSGELLGYVLIGADLHATGSGDELDKRFSWHTLTPTYRDLPRWVGDELKSELRRQRFEDAGVDIARVDTLSARPHFRTMGLTEVSTTGKVQQPKASRDPDVELVVPFALCLMLVMMVMTAAPMLLNNVVEEKTQKIAEVLLSTVSPFELLMGKLLSSVGVAMTLSVLYVGGAIVAAHWVADMPTELLDAITPGILAWFVVFLVMTLLIYGAIFSAFGAAASEMQEAQNLMGWMMMLFFAPALLIEPILSDPGSTVAMVGSLVPPFSPVLMLLRIGIPPGVAWWEPVLAAVLCMAFTVLCVAGAGKIFRIGILAQGETPTFRKLARWVFSK